MLNRKLNLIIFLFFNLVILQAQQIKVISLKEALLAVEKNNNSIKISKKEFNAAKADFNQANSVLLPSIAISHTAISTTNPLMAFGSKLNQEILTQADFNPTLLNDPSETKNFATKIEVKQPILNFDGFYYRKAAKSKMAAFNYKIQRTKEYLNVEVVKAYMQIQLAEKAIEVLEKAVEAANENKKIALSNFKQGYLQKVDLLTIEIHVSEIENQLFHAKNNLKSASDYLKFLMNDDSNSVLKPDSKLEAHVDLNLYQKNISENRADFKALEKSTEAFSNMNKASKLEYLPRLNAFGNYELYDNQLFGTKAKGYLVGAQLSWNLFEGNKRIGKVQKSKAEFEKAQLKYQQFKNKSTLEFNNALRDLKDAENNLNVTKLAVEQTQEALRIRTNRFEQGLEKTADLLVSETQYLQKQLAYQQSVFTYNYTKAYVQFLLN